jgi:hypothetical protein
MKPLALKVRKSLFATAMTAKSLCFIAHAQAAGPAAPPLPDKPVSLSVAPQHVYRPPSIIGASPLASDPTPASGADDWANRQPGIEKPDNWACRTSNNLSRSSAGRNAEGKSTFDIEHLLPKC